MKKEYVFTNLAIGSELSYKIAEEFDTGYSLRKFKYDSISLSRLTAMLSEEDLLAIRLKYGKEIMLRTPENFIELIGNLPGRIRKNEKI